VEGQNLAIEYRSADSQRNRLPTLAAELVRHRVNVIVTAGNAAALAAKAATATIPIVFSIGGNSVELGLVASINRPGGNITGISLLNSELDPKRLATTAAFLTNPDNLTRADKIERMQAAALRRELQTSTLRRTVMARKLKMIRRPCGAISYGGIAPSFHLLSLAGLPGALQLRVKMRKAQSEHMSFG
jgi:putative tryptophan/tyrosine transport system substrate-binding protein